MNRLDTLIEELCPDGVEYVRLDEICNITRGRVMSKDYLRDNVGDYPVYSSQTANNGIFGYINTYDFDCESITWTTDGANAGSVFYHSDKRFSITNVCGLLRLKDKAQASTKFMYYALQIVTKSYVNSGMGNPKLMSNVMAKVVVPLPPLPIQRKIVEVLDNFTELTARKKQHNYYRDSLLNFADDVQVVTLSQCCLSIADGDHQAPPKADYGVPFITISNVSSAGIIDFSNTKFVPEEYYNALADKRKAQTDDILYTVVGSFGITVFIDSDVKFTFQRHIAILRPDCKTILPKYLYHVLQSSDFMNQANAVATGAAQKTITLTVLNKMKVPLPSIDKQARIVDILDHFNELVSDIKTGLPAEIAARQKQYEYYRDKLLTFEVRV